VTVLCGMSTMPAHGAWRIERWSDVARVCATASQGRENSFASANELFLTDSPIPHPIEYTKQKPAAMRVCAQ
jgi:hypothetical protein